MMKTIWLVNLSNIQTAREIEDARMDHTGQQETNEVVSKQRDTLRDPRPKKGTKPSTFSASS